MTFAEQACSEQDRRERVVDVVCDAARERADALESLRPKAPALRFAVFRDVLPDADDAHDRAVCVPSRAGAEQQVHDTTVLGAQRELEVRGVASLHRGLEHFCDRVAAPVDGKLREIPAQRFVARIARDPLGARVPHVDAVFAVLAEDRRVGRLDQAVDVVRGGLCRMFGDALVVDVDARSDDLERLPVHVTHQRVVVAEPAVATVRQAEAILVGRAPVGERAAHRVVGVRVVVRMQVLAPELGVVDVSLRCVAELALDVLAHERVAEVAFGFACEHDGGNRCHHVAESLLDGGDLTRPFLDALLQPEVELLQFALGQDAPSVLEVDEHDGRDRHAELFLVASPCALAADLLAAEHSVDFVAQRERKVQR